MRKGFTLIELMIVVAIIAIIAAIAIPNLLESKKAANETNTIGALKSYCTAQTTYMTNNYSFIAFGRDPSFVKCYAPSFQNLGGQFAHPKSDGNRIELIPAVFAEAFMAAQAYQGYFFTDVPMDAGNVMFSMSNWKYGHGLSGTAAVWDKSGTNTFAIGVEGTVYMKDFGVQGNGGEVASLPNPALDVTWVSP